ncbi:MAG: response regulator [Flavobacteriales bacterium]
MKTVLIVEDDKAIVDLLEIHINDLDCKVLKAYDGEKGLELALKEKPDLMILDVSMPKMDGFQVCQKVRAEQNTPIIMLTAKSEEIDRVLGLEIGADDYITKPFSVRELIARIKAIFRRTNMNNADEEESQGVLKFDGLTIDREKRKVVKHSTKIDLSPKEFDLLVLMASKPGKSYSRSDLLNLIWGYDFDGYEHTVNSHINRLRSKIEDDMANPKYIITSWGIGYKFNEEIN